MVTFLSLPSMVAVPSVMMMSRPERGEVKTGSPFCVNLNAVSADVYEVRSFESSSLVIIFSGDLLV